LRSFALALAKDAANCKWPKTRKHDDQLVRVAAERGVGELLTCRSCHPFTVRTTSDPGTRESGNGNSTRPSDVALRALEDTTTAGSWRRARIASGDRCVTAAGLTA